jgi:hypothetical protein
MSMPSAGIRVSFHEISEFMRSEKDPLLKIPHKYRENIRKSETHPTPLNSYPVRVLTHTSSFDPLRRAPEATLD